MLIVDTESYLHTGLFDQIMARKPTLPFKIAGIATSPHTHSLTLTKIQEKKQTFLPIS